MCSAGLCSAADIAAGVSQEESGRVEAITEEVNTTVGPQAAELLAEDNAPGLIARLLTDEEVATFREAAKAAQDNANPTAPETTNVLEAADGILLGARRMTEEEVEQIVETLESDEEAAQILLSLTQSAGPTPTSEQPGTSVPSTRRRPKERATTKRSKKTRAAKHILLSKLCSSVIREAG